MKWLMIIVWMVGPGTPPTVVPFENETLCDQARSRVMQPQPTSEPIVNERKQIAYAICLQVRP